MYQNETVITAEDTDWCIKRKV